MRKTLQRFWTGMVLLTPALALADAEHGGLELSSLTVVRTNSFGVGEDLRLGYRLDLGRPGSSFLMPHVQLAVNPANVQTGVGLTVQPFRGLSMSVAYAPRFNFAGKYGFQSFGSPRDDYRDQVLTDRADAGLTYTTWQHRLVVELDVGIPLGPLVLHDVARVTKNAVTLRGGDTVFYDFVLDTLVAAHGWTLENQTELLWLPDEHWVVGIRNTLVQAWYPDSAYRPGESPDNPNTPMLKLGPLLAYCFERKGQGLDAPTLFVEAAWWLRHRYRAGEDVSQAVPTVLAGLTFKVW